MRLNSGSSSRSGSRTPRRVPDQTEALPHIGLDDDIEDWLERAPRSTRGKTRRAVRRHGQDKAPAHQTDSRGADYGAPTTSRAKTKRRSSAVQAARVRPPADSDGEALASRKRSPFWKYVRRACLMLCLVLVAEGGVALLSSPKCAISEVQVRGAKETPSTTLDTICASLVGQNFLRADRKSALERTQLIPTVASASLTRDWMAWPPRLVLSVKEREPFARVGAGNDWWVVDESGVPFRAARPEDAKLYAVTAPTLEPKAGKALNDKAWKPVVEFASLLNRDAAQGNSWSLRRVYFDKHGFASLRLSGGKADETLVQLGADGWPEKLQSARWALNDINAHGRHAESINLISSSVATWTPRAEGEPGAAAPEAPVPGAASPGVSPQDAPLPDAASKIAPPQEASPEASPKDASPREDTPRAASADTGNGTQVAPATSRTPGSAPV